MPNVQIRDVPEDIHRELTRRATRAGQSLQQYLAGQLADIARTPSVDDVLDRIERSPKGRVTTRDALDALAADRAGR